MHRRSVSCARLRRLPVEGISGCHVFAVHRPTLGSPGRAEALVACAQETLAEPAGDDAAAPAAAQDAGGAAN